MYVYLKNGKSFHVVDANFWRVEHDKGFLICIGLRKREIMRFHLDAVAGWCYDSEDVAVFGVTEQREEAP